MFMGIFVPCVAGLKLWTMEAQKTKLVSKTVTPSDEALAVLLLINSIERWEEMYQHEELKMAEAVGGAESVEDDCEEVESDFEGGDKDNGSRNSTNHPLIGGEGITADQVTKHKKMKWKPTRYTMDCKKKQSKEFGGWNNEGRRMYNKLLDDIKEDRFNRAEWEKKYLRRMATLIDFNEGKKGKRTGKIVVDDVEEVVEAKNDLCYSDSDEETDEEVSIMLGCPDREDSGDEDDDEITGRRNV
jgi:hypothetical protein